MAVVLSENRLKKDFSSKSKSGGVIHMKNKGALL